MAMTDTLRDRAAELVRYASYAVSEANSGDVVELRRTVRMFRDVLDEMVLALDADESVQAAEQAQAVIP